MPDTHPHASELPAPIPWLGAAGPVKALDARTPGPPAPVKASCGRACGCSSGADAPDTIVAPAKAQGIASVRASAVSKVGGWFKRFKKRKRKLPGSGIPARKIIRVLQWVRRGAQVVFLGLFLYFLAQTAFRGSFAAEAGQPVRLPLPVEAFLLADPFVAAMTLLSTHTVYRGLAWSVGVIALTVLFGRVFCGWICPFGTLHHFFGWIFPSRYLKGNSRVDANKTRWWQAGKYYLMYGFLGAALVGSSIGGLMDPICVAVRAIGLGVIDSHLPRLTAALGRRDVLIFAADHGNDPTDGSTDHTREYVPLLAAGLNAAGVDLGIRATYADVAATVCDGFDIPLPSAGTSFLEDIR